MFFNNKKILIFFLQLLVVTFCFGCKKNIQIDFYDTPKIFDYNLFDSSYIIVPKNQTNGQGLSCIIKNKEGDLIVFDGGRVEDGEYLRKIIKNNGGIVKAWFLTHIHDDHIGALYYILNNKFDDIKINKLYYNFADINWYYSKVKEDAGIVNLFYETLSNYNDTLEKNGKNAIEIIDKLKKNDVIRVGSSDIKIMNDIYLLDNDSINNSSICYKVFIENKKICILGDLGYEGGRKLINESTIDDLSCDICFLSHHGQNGVPREFYILMFPDIVVWPTSQDIYENKRGVFDTEETKRVLDDMDISKQIISYKYTSIIK